MIFCFNKCVYQMWYDIQLFTARKWSLGQGNVFTGVCLSTQEGGLCPRGGGLCLGKSLSGRHPWQRPLGQRSLWTETPQTETPQTETKLYGKEPAVRILLECILVLLESFPISYTRNLQMVVWKLELPERDTELHLNQKKEENTVKAIKNRLDCLVISKLLLSYISQSKLLSSF